MSSAWRVVVDCDARTITGGTAAAHGAPSYGKLDREATHPVTDAECMHLAQRFEAARLEPPPDQPPSPIADYGELMILANGDDIFYFDGYGPIRQPRAAELIRELRTLAGL